MSSEGLGEPRLEWAAGGQHPPGDSGWTRSSSSRKQQGRPAGAVHAEAFPGLGDPVLFMSVTESSDTLCYKSLRRQSGKPSAPEKRITTSKSSVCGLGSKVLSSSIQKSPITEAELPRVTM